MAVDAKSVAFEIAMIEIDLDLKDRVAIVTGGGGGIGEAIARSLSAEGCTICILDRNADAANTVASAIARSGTPDAPPPPT